MQKVITAPDFYSLGSLKNHISEFSLFLGGSIDNGKAENWQNKVIKTLRKNRAGNSNFLVILNSRRDDWNSSWEYSKNNKQLINQINWEMQAQNMATHILYYFAPNSLSPISLLELGTYGTDKTKKTYVVCSKDYFRWVNVHLFCAEHGIILFDTLDEFFEYFKLFS